MKILAKGELHSEGAAKFRPALKLTADELTADEFNIMKRWFQFPELIEMVGRNALLDITYTIFS